MSSEGGLYMASADDVALSKLLQSGHGGYVDLVDCLRDGPLDL